MNEWMNESVTKVGIELLGQLIIWIVYHSIFPQSSCWLPCFLRHELNCEHGGRSASWGERVRDGRIWKLGEDKTSPKLFLQGCFSYHYPVTGLWRHCKCLQWIQHQIQMKKEDGNDKYDKKEDRNQFQRIWQISCTHQPNPYPLESIMVTFKTWMDHFT